jgi:hypothetical protein
MARKSDKDNMELEEHVRTCCEAKILGLASSAGMKKYIYVGTQTRKIPVRVLGG